MVKANVEDNDFCKLIIEHLSITEDGVFNLNNICGIDSANYIKYRTDNDSYGKDSIEVIKRAI
ncbi:MAG: hypothetical protein U0X86_001296 [Wolbachia endosymbiont of Xenopsylla cheopis]